MIIQSEQSLKHTVKTLNIQTPQKFAVNILKIEQNGFSKGQCPQKMQPELQTV